MSASFARKPLVLLILISLLGFTTHSIPHDMGVSTVGAIGMLAAAYLPRHLLLWPVLVTVFLVDAFAGFYAPLAMLFVYIGHLSAAYLVRPILAKIRPGTVIGAGFASAVVFYLLSNMTPMAMGYYPATLDGWLLCYSNGLPYLFRDLIANIVFGGLFFAAAWILGNRHAYRFAATERH